VRASHRSRARHAETREDAPLSIDPSATVFHYAQCLFEGLKAYRDTHGKVTLFRPDMNMRRMNNSAQRIALPVPFLCSTDVFV
jgi:branched-chain amino acid aminotransferase